MNRPDAVLFDLDGTLIDSVPDIASAVNAMLLETGRATHPTDVVRGWVGRGLSVLMHRAITGTPDGEAESAEHREAIRIFRHHYASCCTRHTTVFEGGHELLGWLKERAIATAIVTNKPDRFAEQIVAALDLVVDVVIGATDQRPLKPNPASLCEAVSVLGAKSPLMIGDTSFDLDAARAAGIPFAGVQLEGDLGRNISELLEPHEPVFESLADLHRWLAEEVIT